MKLVSVCWKEKTPEHLWVWTWGVGRWWHHSELGVAMIEFLCYLDWVIECPGFWLNIISKYVCEGGRNYCFNWWTPWSRQPSQTQVGIPWSVETLNRRRHGWKKNLLFFLFAWWLEQKWWPSPSLDIHLCTPGSPGLHAFACGLKYVSDFPGFLICRWQVVEHLSLFSLMNLW